MIEGQEDVTWPDWVAIADACERGGIETLMRSDHYLSVEGARERSALDAWGTVCGLAARTERLRLGTLLSPASFRHPSVLAKLATTADHISGGRVELGLGAGWSEPEHAAYGFPFAPLGTRMDVLAEQLEVIHGHWSEGPFTFHGRHYQLDDLDALPKPLVRPHPPLIMGGQAGPRSLALAARFADEYNLVMVTPRVAAERGERLARACREAGRPPMPLSLMTTTVIGADAAEFHRRVEALADRTGQALAPDELPDGWLGGPLDRVVERLGEYAAAGVERVYLQHLVHTDLAMIELIAGALVPAVGGLSARAPSA